MSQHNKSQEEARAGQMTECESYEAGDDVFSSSSASSVNNVDDVGSSGVRECEKTAVRRRSQSLSLENFVKPHSSTLTRRRRSSCEVFLPLSDNGDIPTELVSIENKIPPNKKRRRSSSEFSEECEGENLSCLPGKVSGSRRRASSCSSYDCEDENCIPEKFMSPVSASNGQQNAEFCM